ncbi:penicillin-binding transpeptidase domain-containing protein [Sphaerisporangium sp. NPDC005289]|uniref:penicillin-binding transpeptidase domain-containing protein n=1 Tax=Sphaerisporangium sp. NPDC005289 TaxID=3155247 RepID=UPI0033AC30A2
MRRRGLLALFGVTVVIIAASLVALVLDARRITGTPEAAGRAYLDAWAAENLPSMREMVFSPPADFLDQHRRLSTDLQVLSIKLTPGTLVRHGERAADLPFEGVRQIGELGQWRFSSVLHLAVRDGAWKVVWTPQTLHPGVAAGERLRLAEIPVPGTELLTRQGRPLPHASGAETYLRDLSGKVDDFYDAPSAGWAIEAGTSAGRSRNLVVFRRPAERTFRTTLDWWTQAAAARALDGLDRPAAVVAVRPSTGEVLAVADRLAGQGAFYQPAPPGSTFKIVTAAALLGDGMSADTPVPCPARYTIPNGRTFTNHDDQDHGTVSLRRAFALSCNTTFARLAVERLGDGALRREATELGFGGDLKSGIGGTCGTMRRAGDRDELGADAIGQNSVQATPLCMALVAAAVRDGTWRPPRLMSEKAVKRLEIDGRPKPRRMPGPVVAQLRSMMAAVVTEGTAAGSALPGGVAGKTGTAETGTGEDHSWFVGYRGDLAFAVFVEHGGAGAGAAATVAARFLGAL